MVFLRHPIFIPIFLYSITASMFLPVFQSFLYGKVCALVRNGSEDCMGSAAARDPAIHRETNIVMLVASVCMCVTGMLSSYFIGRLGDTRSRKLSLLIPFTGLILADISLILQTYFTHLSPYYFAVSELIFGCFGGYMAIISSSFAFLTSSDLEPVERGKAIARMEGLMGLGGMIGFFMCSQLSRISYFNACCFFLANHLVCFVFILWMDDAKPSAAGTDKIKALQSLLVRKEEEGSLRSYRNLSILLSAFAASFFAFIGSAHILFFYLKQRFAWDAEQYSYLRALLQALSTFMALVVYPHLKARNISDVRLAVMGLLARAAGKAWMALAWSPAAVFAVVSFDMFSRFPATALRSLIAANVGNEKRGGAFALVGALEGGCNLLAAVVFHSLFPWSLSFLPQLSFLVMSALIIPPTILMWLNRRRLEEFQPISTTSASP